MKKFLYLYSFLFTLLALCKPLRTAAQAPSISYSGVATSYIQNTAISALTPTNTGTAVTGTYGEVTTLAGSGSWGFANGTGTAASFGYPHGVAADASGNVYVADMQTNSIRKITAAGVVTTLAGSSSGTSGFVNGTGTAARFSSPYGVAVDASGNVYVADGSNNRIRKITAAGVVTTFAGSGTGAFADGTGAAASFRSPYGVAVDASGNVYVADAFNNRIRKITAAGVVTTLAGSGTAAFADGTGTAASFNAPIGVAVDASGNVYVGDYGNQRIRKITAAGVVTTLAGNGTQAFADGTGTVARFSNPYGVAVDASGNVYVADGANNRIRKITAAGVVTTLAGSGTDSFVNGTGTAASFNNPRGVAVDASRNVYVADATNNRIRKVSIEGYSISPTLPAGLSISPTTGVISGTPTAVSSSTTYTVTAINASGSGSTTVTFSVECPIIIAYNVTGTGSYCAGGTGVAIGLSGSESGVSYQLKNGASNVGAAVSGTGAAISFGNQTTAATYTVIATSSGCTATMTGSAVVTINPLPTIYSLSGSAGVAIILSNSETGVNYQLMNGTTTVGLPLAGTSGIALNFGVQSTVGIYTVVATNTATGCTVSMGAVSTLPAPNLSYSGVAAAYPLNTTISLLTPTNTGGAVSGIYGAVTTLEGSGSWGFANGTGTAASFGYPQGVAVDATGNVYVADMQTNSIRKITAAGVVTTLAGSSSGTSGFADGTGTGARFSSPQGVAVDASGNVYVADGSNNRIRKITAAGVVTTLAGSGTGAFADGTGAAASFNYPFGVAVDASGNVYVSDAFNHRIRKITAAGVVTTLAGSTSGFADGAGTGARFNTPFGVAVDASGNVYVGEYGNQRIRKITSAGVVTTLAGNGTQAFADGTGTVARFSNPYGVTVDASGNVYVADGANNRIRKITAVGVVTTLAGSGTDGFADGIGTAASFNNPRGVAVDASGNVYVADATNNRIRKVSIEGYDISPTLPAGLSISPTTGVISGTPTAPTPSTTYTVTAINASGSGTTTVTFGVVACATPTAYNVTGTGSYCEGGTGLAIGLSNSESGVTYQLKNGATDVTIASGTGSAINFSDQTAAGTYTIVATSTSGGCTATMSSSAVVTIAPTPTVYTVTGSGVLCPENTVGLAIGLSNSSSNTNYQLKKDGTNVGSIKIGTGAAISFGNFLQAGTYTVVATSAQGCIATMTGSAIITIGELIASHSVNGGGILCAGDDGGLSIDLSNSEIGVSYQLKKNGTTIGSPIAGTGAALIFGNLFDAGTYMIVATNAQGCTAVMTGNAIITLSTLSENYMVTGGGAFCAGTDGVEVGLSGSQTGVSYQLKKDNANVGTAIMGTGTAISFGKQTATGTYTVNATLLAGACTVIFQNSIVVSIDETLPALVMASVPANITLNCNDVIPISVNPIATSSCTTVSMTESTTKGVDISQCSFYSYIVTRTWTATDKLGNTATVNQVITVRDNTAPMITLLPNITVTEAFIPTTVANTDNCMASPTVTFIETKENRTLPPCKTYAYTLNRTWNVTDACGNNNTATQIIKVEGISLTCPSDKTINTNSDGVNNYNCSSLATFAMGVAPTFLDGCDVSVLRYIITGATTGNGSGSVAGVTFMKDVSTITYNLNHNLTDVCSFKITVLDNEAPKITLTPTVVLDACTMPDPIPNTYDPSITDNCTGTNTMEIMSDVLADVSGCSTKTAAQKYTKLLTRTWKVTDENGNIATATQRIFLRDMAPPITVCKNLTINIGSTNITQSVSSLNNGSNDNCTAANALAFVGCMNTTTACTNFGTNLTLRSSMIPAGQNQTTITVLVKARDACGNETATPVSTIITLKRLGSTMNNTTNGSDNSMAIQDTESSIPAEASTVPTAQGEMKCYPTPFSEDLNIQYNLTENIENVTLKLYDTQGRLVTKMEQESQVTGYYQVRWNLSDLQAGMYHVCLELNGKCTKMERVIMLK